MIDVSDIIKTQNEAVAAEQQATQATQVTQGEEKVAEQKAEEKIEVKETIPAQEIEKAEEKQEEQKDTFIEEINKRFSRSYKNADEITEALKKADSTGNYDELAKKIKDYEEAANKMKDFLKPEKRYGTQEKYELIKRTEKLIAEGKDPDIVHIALTADMKKVNDLEAITLDLQLSDPSYDEIQAAVLALSKINIEMDGDPTEKEIDEVYKNLTMTQRVKLKDLAAPSRKNIEAIRNTEFTRDEPEDYFKNLEEQDKQNLEKKQEREKVLKEGWKLEYEKIRLASEKIKIPETVDGKEEIFEFSVDKETLTRLPEIIEKSILQSNLDPTPENIELAKKTFIDEYMKQNWAKAWSAGRKELRSKLTAEFIEKTQNPQGFSTKVNTGGQLSEADIAASQLQTVNNIFKT